MSRVLLLAALLPLAANAEEEEDATREPLLLEPGLTGHVKMFGTALFPYDHRALPPEPVGQGIVDVRLNGSLGIGVRTKIEIAHAVTATLGSLEGASVGIGTGVAPQAAQLVDLGWEALDADASTFRLLGRTDRLFVKTGVPGLDVTIGRQPISFGQGRFFTPLDLVNPFTPAVIDTEYKPGVDGVRLDGYVGTSLMGTVAVTWADGPIHQESDTPAVERFTAAAYGQGTVGISDIGIFLGAIRGDLVTGASLATSIGAVGLFGDAALTVPTNEDETPFFRGTFGAMWVPHPKLMTSAEAYVQTLGSTDPDDLLSTLVKDRWTRGDLWLAGVAYLGLTVSYEVTPLLNISLASIGNLTDPSAFLSTSVSWSVAENADVLAGAYVGLGSRPDELVIGVEPDALILPDPNSEFGLYPAFGFLQVRTYF